MVACHLAFVAVHLQLHFAGLIDAHDRRFRLAAIAGGRREHVRQTELDPARVRSRL